MRAKQSKRQRISTVGQSGQTQPEPHELKDIFETDLQGMSMDEKVTLLLSKASVNESRVSAIQSKLDAVLNIRSRVTAVENVIRSQNNRLKLLEYRSIDLEARSSRRNLLFKDIPEQRRESCFTEVRRLIHEDLRINRHVS